MASLEPATLEDEVELTSDDVIDEADLEPPRPAASPRRFSADQWVLLLLSAGVLLMALILENRGAGRTEQVFFPGVDIPLPETCQFKRTVGLDCPGCGLTRSFIAMAHADFARAWLFNPGGVFFFLVVAFQVPYRIYQLVRIRSGRRPYSHPALLCVMGAVAAIMFAQWLGRLFGL